MPDESYRERYRHAACWQLHRSSVVCFDSLQYSLQYLPYSPPLATVQLQLGCAHLVGSTAGDCSYDVLDDWRQAG